MIKLVSCLYDGVFEDDKPFSCHWSRTILLNLYAKSKQRLASFGRVQMAKRRDVKRIDENGIYKEEDQLSGKQQLKDANVDQQWRKAAYIWS